MANLGHVGAGAGAEVKDQAAPLLGGEAPQEIDYISALARSRGPNQKGVVVVVDQHPHDGSVTHDIQSRNNDVCVLHRWRDLLFVHSVHPLLPRPLVRLEDVVVNLQGQQNQGTQRQAQSTRRKHFYSALPETGAHLPFLGNGLL